MFLEVGDVVIVGRDGFGEFPQDAAEQPDLARDLVDRGAQGRVNGVDLLEHPMVEQDQTVRHEVEIRGSLLGGLRGRMGLHPDGGDTGEGGGVQDEHGRSRRRSRAQLRRPRPQPRRPFPR